MNTFDLCIYGGNAAGIAAAYSAAEMGLKVAVVEYTSHPGGMSAAGLGHTDQSDFAQLGGVSGWFYDQIKKHYQENEYVSRYLGGKAKRHEPHVAENIFLNMIKEKNIAFFTAHRLNRVTMDGKRIKTAIFDYAPPGIDGVPPAKAAKTDDLEIEAGYFMDASYEGDLLAAAGVSYTVGRESRDTYGESYAGSRLTKELDIDAYKIPGKPESGLLPLLQPYDGKKDGEADYTTQAYNFRMCLTDRENQVPIQPPANYDPAAYELFGRWIELWEKQNKPMLPEQYHEQQNPYFHPRLLKFSPIPNGKVDLNNAEGGSTDMVGYSRDWPEGSWEVRSKLWQQHVDYTKGLLYFLRTDPRVRPETRAELARWGLPTDEFKDTNHWPFQLYVREARRMKGEFIMTQSVCQNDTVTDSIGLGSYPLDSHNCRRLAKDGKVCFEGSFWDIPQRPHYRISMRSLLPLKKECENLTVPVCVSASHVAYASLRMEPIMMIMGEAAAVISALAAEKNAAVQDIEYDAVRTVLKKRKACLDKDDLANKKEIPFKHISIQPYRWTDEDIAAQQKKCEELAASGVTHIAFCSSLEPSSVDKPFEQVEQLAAQFKKLRAGINSNVKVGFLIQSLLSHGWRTEALPGYSEIITVEGKNNHRFCPLNQKFRDYTATVVTKLCEVAPDFILVDDDFRMLLAGIGCFCPDHLARFEKLVGRKYSREELAGIFNKTDAESRKLGDMYSRMVMDSLQEVAAIIRKSIDAVNPDLECGFCTSCEGEYVYAAETAKILAGKNEPFIRLNNGFYLEDGALSFPYRHMNTAIQHHYIGDKVKHMISECDTFPQNRYSLTLTGMDMHITSSIMAGCSGMKMWIENHRRHDEKINRLYMDFVNENWKKWRELYAVAKRYRWLGVTVPLPGKAPTFHNPSKVAKLIKNGDFIADAFGVLGIAASYVDDGSSIAALTGDQMKFFSDIELKELLKRKLIIDITGVRELLARGFGGEIGVKDVIDTPQNVLEVITDAELKAKNIPEVLSFLRPNSGQIVPAEGVRILSHLSKLPFPNGPTHLTTPVAPASVYFKNSRGGEIISLAFPMTREVWSRNMNIHHADRKPYFMALLELLDAKRAPVYVDTDQSCYLMYKFRGEDNTFLAAVYNISLDPMKKVSLKLPKTVKKLTVLQNDGSWKEVAFKQQNGFVTIDNPDNKIPVIIRGDFE